LRLYTALIALGYLAALSSTAGTPDLIIRIAPDGPGRLFDGLGAVSAGASSRLLMDYPEPYRSQILDYLFKPHYGASLQHLKVEIGADTDSTEGSEPSHMRTRDDLNFQRGYEWWLMKEARRRNPGIFLDCLAWGAPGWIGGGKYYSPDMAEYVARFIEGARRFHGLDIDFTGSWNEVRYDSGWLKLLRKTLDAHGLKTRIVAPDMHASAGVKQWDFIREMQADPELDRAIYAVGVHYPRTAGKVHTPDWAKESGKRLWSSEDQPAGKREWIPGGRSLAQLYNRNYIDGRMTKTEIWSPVTSYYDNLAAPHSGLMYANTPWSGHYEVQSTVWVTAHTTQFAQPGWIYIDSACGDLPGNGSYVTLRSPASPDYSVVIETIGATKEQTVAFQLTGAFRGRTVHVWRSNREDMFRRQSDIKPRDGAFTIALDPDALFTLTTTTGQHKGSAAPPPASPFPFPYRDDFEKTALGQAPKYFSDQNGAFEAAACSARPGRCLRQVVTKRPIPWGLAPDPHAFLGSAAWQDYRVMSDVLFEEAGQVTLIGRIDSANWFVGKKARWPSAYVLAVSHDGKWELDNSVFNAPAVKLAWGDAPIGLGVWHRLALAFNGPIIEVSIDGRPAAKVSDSAHKSGMAGIGTGWNHAQFDNFTVESTVSERKGN
jgi:galactosylceramidase